MRINSDQLEMDDEGRFLLDGNLYDGEVFTCYENGMMRSEGYCVGGMTRGEARGWYRNGNLKYLRTEEGIRYWTPTGRAIDGDGALIIEHYDMLEEAGVVDSYVNGYHDRIEPSLLRLLEIMKRMGFFPDK